MKRRTILLAITLALFAISWFFVFPETNTFTVPAERVDAGKSAALYEKWDGKGNFVDMIWR